MKILLRITFALVYTIGYGYLALENAGAGHGTFLFFAPIFTWLLVLLAILLLSSDPIGWRRVALPLMLCLHYFVTAVMVVNYLRTDDGSLYQHWDFAPSFVVVTIAWYVVGQVLIWAIFLRQFQRGRQLQ